MRQLLNVGDVFDIPGRGVVLIARTELSEVGFRAGDHFELVLPTGKRCTLTALGVERFTKCFTEATTLGVLVGDQLGTLDEVIGSELWINSSSEHGQMR
jgi:translation elongation factor EF-Tu-like GTPase